MADVTIKLGVLALAEPDNGGTYQYTLSMLQALRHTNGLQITLYGDPQKSGFCRTGLPDPSLRGIAALSNWPL